MAAIYKDVAPLRRDDDGFGMESPPVPASMVPITVVEPQGHARGAIVVLHEGPRVTSELLGLLHALAREGWIAVVPNLFHRGRTDVGVFGADLFDDFAGCHDWLTARGILSDCIGVLGFADAGTAAFLVATNQPVGAAVSVSARGLVAPLAPQAPALVDAADSLQAPWLGLFGADDPATPSADVDALADAVAAAVVATNIVRYAASVDEADIVDAQTRIFDWFDAFLR